MNFLEELAFLDLPVRRMRRWKDERGGQWDELPNGWLRRRLLPGSPDPFPEPMSRFAVESRVGRLREMTAAECARKPWGSNAGRAKRT